MRTSNFKRRLSEWNPDYGDLFLGPDGKGVFKVTNVFDEVYTLSGVDNYNYLLAGCDTELYKVYNCEEVSLAAQPSDPENTKVKKVKSDGGVTSYYDFPFHEWNTTNDMMEFLSRNKWGAEAIHLKDIFKGLCRWGEKSGTDTLYDTKKIIYYGARVMRMLVGVGETRKYLQELLNDKQFGG